MKVVWVKICKDQRFKGSIMMEWMPIYWSGHTDKEISVAGSGFHFHIAWNRIPMQDRPYAKAAVQNHFLVEYPVFADYIVDYDFDRPTPIVGPPIKTGRNFTLLMWVNYVNHWDGIIEQWPPKEINHGAKSRSS